MLKATLLSNEHFTVDGTLIEACASFKSFRQKDDKTPPTKGTRNDDVNFHGHKLTNETHASTTVPMPGCSKKGKGKKPSFAMPAMCSWRTATASL